jgi:hypothetical protein
MIAKVTALFHYISTRGSAVAGRCDDDDSRQKLNFLIAS